VQKKSLILGTEYEKGTKKKRAKDGQSRFQSSFSGGTVQIGLVRHSRWDIQNVLPDPLPPSRGALDAELAAPGNGLQQHIMAAHARHAGVDFPDHIPSQRNVFEWLRVHCDIHRAVTAEWKASKATPQYRVVVQPWGGVPNLGNEWTVHMGPSLLDCVQHSDSSRPRGRIGASMVVTSRRVGSNLTVSVCYPNNSGSTSLMEVYDRTQISLCVLRMMSSKGKPERSVKPLSRSAIIVLHNTAQTRRLI